MALTKTISDAKTDLDGILKGTTTDQITSINSLFNRAGRQILLDIDPQETKKLEAFNLYDSVFDYAAPADLKGKKILDIRPQINRRIRDNFSQYHDEEFDQYKLAAGSRFSNRFNVRYNNGTKFVRVDKVLTAGVKINTLDTISDNGTWAVTGDGENLRQDKVNKEEGGGSLRFDADGIGTTIIMTNSDMTKIDLSTHEDQSGIFAQFFFPLASAITSVNLEWGSSTTKHWSRTVTAPHFGSFRDGWNQLRFDWDGATETGSPVTADAEAIDHLKATITYDGTADTDFRMDVVESILPEIWEFVYYSKFIFQTSAGVFIEDTTKNDDKINLDTESYNLFIYKSAEFAAQQVETLGGDLEYFNALYNDALRKYKSQVKSETIEPQSEYYRMTNNKQGIPRRRTL